jgi:hypothetical protein
MITVWNKNVNWPDKLSANDNLYWRTVINRYQVGGYDAGLSYHGFYWLILQAFSNIIWDMAKEAWRIDDSYWADRLPLVAALVGWTNLRLLTSILANWL